MKFKIENERLRIRRQSEESYSYEIPEWNIKRIDFASPKAALDSALAVIESTLVQDTKEIQCLEREIETLVAKLAVKREDLKALRNQEHSPIVDLLEQQALCRHAIGMLECDEEQPWGHKVKMVGFYDQGDVDEDGDRDFIVSYTW